VAVISKDHLENFEVCKRLGLWGMVKQFPGSKEVGGGDRILFYLSGVGFKAEAEALESMRALTGNDWKQYDFRNFKWGFRIEFITEFIRSRQYDFSGNGNIVIDIKPVNLKMGFFSIREEQYNKIVLGIGQIKYSASLF